MKGIILAGGRGVRLQKSTLIHNKHLLSVYSSQGAYPMICYPLQTLIKSGCDDILIISSQEHCGDIMEFLGDGHQIKGLKSLTYKIQDHNSPKTNPVGIASALKLCEGFVGRFDPFAVILGDNFYEDSFPEEFKKFSDDFYTHTLKSDGSGFEINKKAHIFLKEVGDPERFGVATIVDGKITKIVEKPKNPESNYAVTGLYLLTGHIMDILPQLKVSSRGELEVSEINDWYVKNKTMTSTFVKGFWHDLGTPQSMLHGTDWINKNKYTIDIYNDEISK